MKKQRNLLMYALLICCLLIFGSGLSAEEDTTLVYVLDIRDEIGGGVSSYISKGVNRAEKANADVIIFDVNTPGGSVKAAEKIIQEIQETKIPTIAFVNRRAISAGAMISTACDQIVMSSGATIGDSQPVDASGREAPEKYVSNLRGTMRSTAERSERNPDIAETMVDKRLYLVQLRNGDIIKLRSDEYFAEQDAGTQMRVLCSEGELLTLTTLQALEYGYVDSQAETLYDLLAQYQIVEIDSRFRDDKGDTKLSVLTQEGIRNKQEDNSVAQVTPIKSLSDAEVYRYAVSIGDRLVFFITSPYISAMLLSLGGLGLFVEIRTPGFGVPGALGLLFIGLFFGGHMLNQIPHSWVPLLFVVGLALIVIEVFVIPGFGIAGILGLILMFGSVFYVFFMSTEDFNIALLWLSISVIITSVLAVVATIFLPKTSPFQRFALGTVMSTEEGYHSAGDEDFQSFLGKTGVALTPLRPAGTARIDNKRLDVVSLGDFIAQNTPVKVFEVEGSKISVEAVEE